MTHPSFHETLIPKGTPLDEVVRLIVQNSMARTEPVVFVREGGNHVTDDAVRLQGANHDIR